jgi:xanthine dehydrogenase YagT iron-sulfur-binding subunit
LNIGQSPAVVGFDCWANSACANVAAVISDIRGERIAFESITGFRNRRRPFPAASEFGPRIASLATTPEFVSLVRKVIVKHQELMIEEQSPSSTTGQITLRINGADRTLEIEPRVSLLDALREYLGLHGAKKGCNQGACGACTVLCDGQRTLSCLALAVQYEGVEITTIEGVSTDGNLHPLQAAFVEQDGFQCGYCTPGQICSAIGMISEFRNGLPSAVTADMASETIDFSDEELSERMSGNLCRCGAYIGIRAAIRQAFESEANQ